MDTPLAAPQWSTATSPATESMPESGEFVVMRCIQREAKCRSFVLAVTCKLPLVMEQPRWLPEQGEGEGEAGN